MDQRTTIKLLDDTFRHDFDLQRFSQFIKELFNKFTFTQKSWSVWQEYQDYIESYQLLGSHRDSKKVIDVLAVKLKKTTSRDRARTMQRNFIAKYLGNAEKDAALVAFYGDDPQDWRFSFVKMEYQLVKDGEKVKISKELTPAKRYSFLVGINEPNHTCRRQFLNLVMEEERSPSLEEIEKAFSIEKVTKEFFEEYKELYHELKESLEKVLENDRKIKKEFEEKNISTIDFCKKLLGQIVFLYFLQKKGWLGVKINQDWGTGPKDFMRRLFDSEIINYKNFFNDVLEPLFYDALNNPREGDDGYHTLFKCKIPFLNGGLFEPINDYNWIDTKINLDDAFFRDIFKTFDTYNFTVKEDEPLEKEVAVDPEMLGKVFENLLDVTDRKSKGAFYTPREIVHYMCQQSLINYLETNSGILREDIEKFIQLGDLALAQIIKEQEQVKKYGKVYDVNENYSIPKSIKQNHQLIDKLLREIKVVDPAVGSGAFPVGMMNEIVRARSILSIYFKEARNDYDLKRETIENCLYGVDIESSAVDIAKLRFWLSLIVDELDMKNIKPLPNLDHKIMCGNSLLEEFEGKKLFDEKLLGEVKKNYSKELSEIGNKIRKLYESDDKENFEKDLEKLEKERRRIEIEARKDKISSQATLDDSLSKRIKESQRKLRELKELQRKFFNEQNRKLKKQLREDIDRLEWGLVEGTLQEEGNTSAIEKLQEYKKNKSKPFFLWKLYFAEVFQRENPGFDVVIANPPYGAELDSSQKEILDKEYYDLKSGTKNSAIYFIYLTRKLLNTKGVNTFIIPKSICYSNGWSNCANYVLKGLIKLIDTGKAFEKVKLEQVIFIRQNNIGRTFYINGIYDGSRILEFGKIDYEIFNNYQVLLTGQTKEELNIIKKILTNFKTKINKYISIERGLNWQSKVQKYPGKKPIYRGAQLSPYFLDTATDFIDEKKFYIQGYDYQFRPKILNQLAIAHVQNPYPHFFLQATIDLQNRLVFETISCTFINNNDINIKFILGLNNSKLFAWLLYKFVYSNAIRSTRYDEHYVGKMPVPELEKLNQKPFIHLVDQILSITKDDDYLYNPDKKAKVKRLEKEIDLLVYKLYELTPEEIKIVEGFDGK